MSLEIWDNYGTSCVVHKYSWSDERANDGKPTVDGVNSGIILEELWKILWEWWWTMLKESVCYPIQLGIPCNFGHLRANGIGVECEFLLGTKKMVPKNRHLSGKRVKIKNDQLQRLTVLMPKNQPGELQSPECEYGTCLLPPKTATSETRDMIGTSSKRQDPRANLWGWVGYRWVPEKLEDLQVYWKEVMGSQVGHTSVTHRNIKGIKGCAPDFQNSKECPGEQPKNMNRMEWVTKLGCSFTRSRHLLANFWPTSIFLYSPSLSVCGAVVSKISTCLMVLLRKYTFYLPATSQNGSPLKTDKEECWDFFSIDPQSFHQPTTSQTQTELLIPSSRYQLPHPQTKAL